MRASFIVVSMTVYFGIAVLPTFAGSIALDRRSPLLLVFGCQVLGASVAWRSLLLAMRPSREPGRSHVRPRRWRRRMDVLVVASAAGTIVGLFVVLPIPLAIGVSLVGLAVVTGVVAGLDRFAARTAVTHPVDVPRPGDAERLAPEAIRARTRGRARLAVVVGSIGAAVAVTMTVAFGRRGSEVVGLGLVVLVGLTSTVFVTGPLALQWAAGRRLMTVGPGDPAEVRRWRRAVLRDDLDILDDDDRHRVLPWARAFEVQLHLQQLSAVPLWTLILIGPVVMLVDTASTEHQVFIGVLAAVALMACLAVRRQRRNVQSFLTRHQDH